MKLRQLALLTILASALFAAACPKSPGSSSSSGGGGLLSFDETDKAADTVNEANKVLQTIKTRFKDNEPRLAELQQAMKAKETDKVRAISDGLVTEIDNGVGAARDAVEKLKSAKDMNINDAYREYLDLKIGAIEKYMDAFEERRQAAILLRDGYDPKNAAKREQVIGVFKQREEKFREIMDEARELSEQANDVAKASLRKTS